MLGLLSQGSYDVMIIKPGIKKYKIQREFQWGNFLENGNLEDADMKMGNNVKTCYKL